MPRKRDARRTVSRTVDDIARLIRENPSIRAQEVADRLSYSEPKAIRYHLQRAGYQNFTQFKEAVLSGAYVPSPMAREDPGPWPRLTVALPLAVRITTAGEPVFGSEAHHLPMTTLGPKAFALRWQGEGCDPYLRRGSLLLIDPAGAPQSGSLWLLLTDQEGLSLWRRYGESAPLYVSATSPRTVLPEPEARHAKVVGRVMEIHVTP
jgi:SOS-response transcriptional repressor LexA